MPVARGYDTSGMTTFLKTRRVAAVALAVAIVPFAASTASAASKHRAPRIERATPTAVVAAAASAPAAAPATTAAAPTTTAAAAAPSVTWVISIGGYVFYNLT